MSDTAYAQAEGLLEGDPKTSRSKAKNLNLTRARVARVVRRTPEVMVKITGNAKGGGHLKTHLDYITRKGKLDAENERGSVISGREDVAEVAGEWTQDGGKRKRDTRDSTNIVLSMPALTDPEAVKAAAREFAKETFAHNYQYLFVLHKDVDHPHVHLTVKNHGYDGTRLHVKKGHPQIWRETFAEKLRGQGLEAEATARAPRGVVRKPTPQAVLALRKRGERPKVDEAKVRAAIKELTEGTKEGREWEEKIKTRQTAVRQSWLTVAKELAKSPVPADQELAAEVLVFVKTMPALKTERHEIQEKLASQLRQVQTSKQAPTKNDPEQTR